MKVKFTNRDNVSYEGRTQVELAAEIRLRAYKLYERRGRADRHALEDWAQAQAEVLERERGRAAA